jgi:small conductance mechanosensitive channel
MEWSTTEDWLLSHGVRILIIILVSAVLYLVMRRLVPLILKHAMRQRKKGKKAKESLEKRTKTLSGIFVTTGLLIIMASAAFMILAEVGINIAPYLAAAGILGVALGFGAQTLVKDIIGGIFIIVEDQYNIGDVIKIASISGTVEEINLRRTVLRDLDGIVHSVGYGEDLDNAISVINRVCAAMAKEPYWKGFILKTPEVLRVDNLGDSGIDIKILGDTKPIKQWETMGEIRKRIKKAFDEEGIEIPWPHTKVYFGQTEISQSPTEAIAPPRSHYKVLPPEDEEGGE